MRIPGPKQLKEMLALHHIRRAFDQAEEDPEALRRYLETDAVLVEALIAEIDGETSEVCCPRRVLKVECTFECSKCSHASLVGHGNRSVRQTHFT